MNEPIRGTELTCREIIDFVMAFIDGELPDDQRAIFVAHLKICADCANYVASYEATIALAKEDAAPSESRPIPDELVQAILAARRGRPEA